MLNRFNRKSIIKIVLGTTIGGLIGFSYYYFIGCKSGSCAITSNPINSTFYGVLLGFIWIFPSKRKDKK